MERKTKQNKTQKPAKVQQISYLGFSLTWICALVGTCGLKHVVACIKTGKG